MNAAEQADRVTICSISNIAGIEGNQERTSIVVLAIPTEVLNRLIEAPENQGDHLDSSLVSDLLTGPIVNQLRNGQKTGPIQFDGFGVDPMTRSTVIGDRTIALPRREFDLLWFFARHPRCVFTRAQLLDYVWGYEYAVGESTVTVHIRRLRQKIEPNPDQPVYLHTVWGIGYMFDPG